ncbi:hypothetical protein V3C99_003656, partial [Haemonchus contortus]
AADSSEVARLAMVRY